MTRAEKAKRIQRILGELYPHPEAPLRQRDPFRKLVATVLSAQCTDKRVNEVTPRLFQVADTPRAMALARVDRIERIIRPCGLSRNKSRSIKELSRIIVDAHGGVVPDSFAELEALPGVGHKTASVVISQAFGRPAFPVDTHIHRLAGRWGLSSGKSVERTERDLKALFPRERWLELHLQLIYFGREHCPARGHDLTRCPICSWAASKRRIALEMGRSSGRIRGSR